MEPHKAIPSGTDAPRLQDGPLKYFSDCLRFVQTNYPEEFERISSVKFEEVDDDFFFQEYVWVVYASGFSAKAVGKFMPRLMKAYGYWDKLSKEEFDAVFGRVRIVCNNVRKAKSVHEMSKLMARGLLSSLGTSWSTWKQENLSSPELLAKLPYIGKITCFHLARNIGLLQYVKPDLHLVRMAKYWGFENPVKMCEAIQEHHTDLPLGLIDLALWYGASSFGTLKIK